MSEQKEKIEKVKINKADYKEDYMTIRETADELGLKVRTIRAWIKLGKITAEKHGKWWFILKEVINSKEVQERADKSREHPRRVKDDKPVGVLAGGGEDPEKSV